MNMLIQCVKDHIESSSSLRVVGSNSQPKLQGQSCTPIAMGEHSGIIDYQPDELFIRVKAGTPIEEVISTLARKNQFLANCPPTLSSNSTIGGMVASNLSGSRRLGFGSVKDQILGLSLINGSGNYLEFGGQVMKNVAGFDASRLLVGSAGAYGIIYDVSLKVLPQPNITHFIEIVIEDTAQALYYANDWQRLPINIIAATYFDNRLHIEIAGSQKAAETACQQVGGEFTDTAHQQQLSHYQHAIFSLGSSLWRIHCDPLATLNINGTTLYEWGGALRFIATEDEDDSVLDQVRRCGGHARKWRGHNAGYQSPISALQHKYQQRLKKAFDPHNLFDDSDLPCA